MTIPATTSVKTVKVVAKRQSDVGYTVGKDVVINDRESSYFNLSIIGVIRKFGTIGHEPRIMIGHTAFLGEIYYDASGKERVVFRGFLPGDE